jgi:hypothetical protein
MVMLENAADSAVRVRHKRSDHGRENAAVFNFPDNSIDEQPAGNLATQRMFRAGAIQANLTFNQSGDIYEQEADRMAEQVVSSTPIGSAQRKCAACAEGATCPKCEEEEQIQKKETPGRAPQATPAMHSQIASLKGGGQPLPPSVLSFFEPRFGHDFSQVRAHTDAKAAESARAVNALAYTMGQEVVFSAGQYSPETSEGRRLLAHELTHVMQQEATGHAVPQRQPAPVALPPEHQERVAAIDQVEDSLQPQREERAEVQREFAETQRTSSDEEEEKELRAREKHLHDRLSEVETDLIDGLQTKIDLLAQAISQIEQLLPIQSGGDAPEVRQEVWDEIDRLRGKKKAAEMEQLSIQRARVRAWIKDVDEEIKKLPEGSQEREALEKLKKEYGEFLSGTAEQRAAPGTAGPRAGESGPDYVVYSDYVKVGGNTPWRNNNPGNVQRSPFGGDPQGVLGVDKWKHFIFESYETGQMAIYFDLVNRRGGSGASLRSVLRSYIAGSKKDEELPEKCGPGDDLAICVTRESAQSYPGKVAGTAGLTDKLDLPISSLSDPEKISLVNAIKQWEGGTIEKGDIYTCADAIPPPLIRKLLGCDE